MDENQKMALREMVCNFDESMKNAMDLMKDIFKVVDPLISEKSEETPKKTVKKRQPRKAKTDVKKEITMTSDILTLNENAPIAAHHSGDKGKGKIEFVELE
jgi:hypothetical protein